MKTKHRKMTDSRVSLDHFYFSISRFLFSPETKWYRRWSVLFVKAWNSNLPIVQDVALAEKKISAFKDMYRRFLQLMNFNSNDKYTALPRHKLTFKILLYVLKCLINKFELWKHVSLQQKFRKFKFNLGQTGRNYYGKRHFS